MTKFQNHATNTWLWVIFSAGNTVWSVFPLPTLLLGAPTALGRGICSLRVCWCCHFTPVQVRWSLAHKYMIISPFAWIISLMKVIHISVPLTIFPICPLLHNVDVAITAFNFYALELSLIFPCHFFYSLLHLLF